MLWVDLKSSSVPEKINIISSPELSKANECYNTAEIKAAGKGDITHYPEIETEDLAKLYNNIYMDPSTPTCLVNRVQMNARLYGNMEYTLYDKRHVCNSNIFSH